MKLTVQLRRLIILAAFLFCFSTMANAQTADFTGDWSLDPSRSEGLPPGMQQTMKIAQSGDTIEVETRLKSEQGEQTLKSSYVLNGKEIDVTLPGPMPGITAQGKQTAKRSTDGKGFESTDQGTFDTPYGPATIKTTRKWLLSDDRSTLTVFLSREGPMTMKSKRVFVRTSVKN
jgi:hypothetical protein